MNELSLQERLCTVSDEINTVPPEETTGFLQDSNPSLDDLNQADEPF